MFNKMENKLFKDMTPFQQLKIRKENESYPDEYHRASSMIKNITIYKNGEEVKTINSLQHEYLSEIKKMPINK